MGLLQNWLKQIQTYDPRHDRLLVWCLYGLLVGALWIGAIAPTKANSPVGKDCIPSSSSVRGERSDAMADAHCKPPATPSNSAEAPYTIWVPGQPERTPPSEYYPANCPPLPPGVTSADSQYAIELYRCKYGNSD